MISKVKEKRRAVNFRKRGLSYREILEKIPVAKSTLSLWLRSVGLSKKQKQRLTQKKLEAALRGAQRRKEQRLSTTKAIKDKAISEIGRISKKEFWLMGVMLYWAEGTKEKEYNPGIRLEFTNSDPVMLRFFIKWLIKIFNLPLERIKFEIYVHENHKNRLPEIKKYWSDIFDIDIKKFQTIYFKKGNVKTKRKNIGQSYFGLVKIRITASSALNRRIAGWIDGVCKSWGVV